MKKALVLSLAVVLGLGIASFAQTLSGSWDTTVTIQPGILVQLGIDSELIVTYAVSGWTFTSDTVLDETGWQTQEFNVGGALGAFTLTSNLEFDPIHAAFDSWQVSGGLSLAGVTFDALFVLTNDSLQTESVGVNDTALQLTGSGTAGNVDVSVTLALGSAVQDVDPTSPGYLDEWYVVDDVCDFDFNGVTIGVTFPFCCAEITSEIAFNCDGFDYVNFTTSGILIPNLPWLKLAVDLNFTTDAKTLVLKPSFNFGAIACFNLYIGQFHSTDGSSGSLPLTLGNIVIEGIGLTCDIGGVQFMGITWLDSGTDEDFAGHGGTSRPAALTVYVGDTPKTYWEMYQISTTDDGCCGPFDFSIGVYFKQGGLQLFDVSLFKADMSIQVATQFTFSTGIIMDLEPTVPGPAFTLWTVGFLVEW